MMGEGDDERWRRELDISGLSLIDEDDSLLLDPSSYEFSEIERGLCLFGDTHEEILVCGLQGNEDVSLDMTKGGNLRKSLAWDKAFFTSAGVLEPHELSSMIETKILPTIQEDVNRSTHSISTLQTQFSDAGKSQEFGPAPSPTPSTSDKRDSQEMVNPKPRSRAQRLEKVTKQPVASISRPPSALGRTKRALVDVNKGKQEKNSILTRGKEPLAPRAPISTSPSFVSKPLVPFKSALRSSVASKIELTSSCSSLESCASASNKSSLKQKRDQSLSVASHSLANGSTSRAASRNRLQPPVVSANRTDKSKLSSNVSCASSTVDWSLGSSQASILNNKGKVNQKTVQQTLKPLKSSKHVSDDPAVRSASMMKPTGLRMPSPKIGYFDGGSSTVARTPTGSSTAPVAKHGDRYPNELTSSRRKSGKSQPTRSPHIQESTNCKAKVSPVSRSPRLMVLASASSPKLTNKMYSKVSAEEQLKGNVEE